jgi:hypothetical protein
MKLWAAGGFLIPLVLMLITRLQGGVFEWPYLALFLWPASIFPAAADSFSDPAPNTVAIFTAIGIGLNVLLYMAVGVLLGRLFRFVHK